MTDNANDVHKEPIFYPKELAPKNGQWFLDGNGRKVRWYAKGQCFTRMRNSDIKHSMPHDGCGGRLDAKIAHFDKWRPIEYGAIGSSKDTAKAVGGAG